MTRLSIVIPMLGSAELMEAGLVSVLENRPPQCEVLLVLNGDYGDPYELQDEVRFVTAPHGAGWAASCNLGVEQASAEIVHLLMPGVEVTADWTEAATKRFGHAEVAAVAPLVLDPKRAGRIVAAGVGYPGRRRLIAGRFQAEKQLVKLPKTPVLGPSCLAGFYRKTYFTAIGGLEPALGDELADVDLALRMEQAGLRVIIEPESIVRSATPRRATGGFRRGLQSERLRLRHTKSLGSAMLTRPLAMLTGFGVRLFYPPRALGLLAGQIGAWCELLRHLRFRNAQPVSVEHVPIADDQPVLGIRHDSAHGPAAARRRSQLRVSA